MFRRFATIIALTALAIAFLRPTALLAQAGSCAEFRVSMAHRLDMLRDSREHLDRVQKMIVEVNLLDPRLKRDVYAREVTRTCELARTMIVVAEEGEKLMRETEARCPAEHDALQVRSLAETTLDYELARRVLDNEKICK